MRIFALGAAVVLLLCTGCIGQSHYENPFKGFSATYPAGWSIMEDERTVQFAPPGNGSSHISVLMAYSDSNTSLEELAIAYERRLLLPLKGIIIENETMLRTTIAKVDAVERDFVVGFEDGDGHDIAHVRSAFIKFDRRYYMMAMIFYENEGGSLSEYDQAYSLLVGNFKIKEAGVQ